jgi:UDP-4-amino-4,6-dideoxy-N-acetyl-beta-L-altrosamine transaminase
MSGHIVIGYGRQDVRPEDIEAVAEILRSDYLTQGPTVERFENAVADRVGAAHGIAVNSATSALHVAYLALGLGPGDLLWTVPNTFVATANAALYCGADVDFVDIESDTWNLDVVALRKKLESADRLPDIVTPVHLTGQPTDQEAIRELAQEYGFKVVEDASHSIGASRNGEPVGSCRWSDITVFSFHPVKIITTGEGGLCTTNDPELAWRMSTLRTHGITRDPERLRFDSPGGWYYEQQALGFNYRITDIQAALGLSQLDRLDEYVKRRNELARRYDDRLVDLAPGLPTIRSGNLSAFHLYVVRVDESIHRAVYDALREAGIGANLHYLPVHLQPYYRDLGFTDGQFPEAEAYAREAITIPLFPTMTQEQQDHVVATLEQLLGG